MSIENVKAYFRNYGLEDRVLEFEVSSATVQLAAEALHCEPCRIAKTLSFMVADQPVLIVDAGDTKIDNPKYKAQFGTKAKMLTSDGGQNVDRSCGQRCLPICNYARRYCLS